MAILTKANPETIPLRGDFLMKEAYANAALSPGHIVEFVPNAAKVEVRPHSATGTGTTVRTAIALEWDLSGKTIEDPYGVNDRVRYGIFVPGAEVQLKVAPQAPAIVYGDALTVSAGGQVVKASGTQTVVAYALASVDNSTGTSAEFIIAEVA